MESENQQVLRLRLVCFMRRLFLIIQLIGLSALWAGSIVGTVFVFIVVGYVFMMAIGASGGTESVSLLVGLLIHIGLLVLIAVYWHFIVLKFFKHVRKNLETKTE